MTIVSQLITDAYRQSNLLAIGVDPTEAQQTEALRYLNRIFKSTLGNEATNLPADFPTATLLLEDEFPFPEEYDDMFITMVAMRLNPAYGQSMDEQSMFHFNRARSQFRAKYHTYNQIGSELGLTRLSHMARDRDGYFYGYNADDSTDAFNLGLPW